MNYEELVKALRCGEYKPECGSSDCPYWSGLGCMEGQLVEDAAAAIEALQAEVRFWEAAVKEQEDGINVLQSKVPNWVSVEDELPDIVEKVLVYNRGQIFTAWRTNFSKPIGAWDSYDFITDGITHWMPLPEPPQEVQDGSKD